MIPVLYLCKMSVHVEALLKSVECFSPISAAGKETCKLAEYIFNIGFFTPTGGRKFYGNYFCFDKSANYRQEYGSIDLADSKTGQNQVLLKICSEIQLFTWENGRKGWLHLLHQRQPVQNLKEKKRKLFEWIPFLEYLVLSEWHLSNMDLSLLSFVRLVSSWQKG